MNSYSEGSHHRFDPSDHVPRNRRTIRSTVKLWIASSFKNQHTFADSLQHGTADDRRIGTTHLKSDDFLGGRYAADGDTAHIAYVLRRIVRIKVRRVRSHRRAV